MNLKYREKVYQKALDKYGIKAQMIACIEELAELQVEISKKLNNKRSDESYLIDEIADVKIVIEQLIYSYSLEDKVKDRLEFKIKRFNGII